MGAHVPAHVPGVYRDRPQPREKDLHALGRIHPGYPAPAGGGGAGRGQQPALLHGAGEAGAHEGEDHLLGRDRPAAAAAPRDGGPGPCRRAERVPEPVGQGGLYCPVGVWPGGKA